jgi:hypothetical protein
VQIVWLGPTAFIVLKLVPSWTHDPGIQKIDDPSACWTHFDVRWFGNGRRGESAVVAARRFIRLVVCAIIADGVWSADRQRHCSEANYLNCAVAESHGASGVRLRSGGCVEESFDVWSRNVRSRPIRPGRASRPQVIARACASFRWKRDCAARGLRCGVAGRRRAFCESAIPRGGRPSKARRMQRGPWTGMAAQLQGARSRPSARS